MDLVKKKKKNFLTFSHTFEFLRFSRKESLTTRWKIIKKKKKATSFELEVSRFKTRRLKGETFF